MIEEFLIGFASAGVILPTLTLIIFSSIMIYFLIKTGEQIYLIGLIFGLVMILIEICFRIFKKKSFWAKNI